MLTEAAHPTRLLERRQEVAAVRRGCDAAAQGRGAVLAIEGPAGIGKTALLEAACAAARAAGLKILVASGTELERELAFGVVRQLLERPLRAVAPDRRDEILAGAAALAAPVLLGSQPASPQPEAVHAAMHGLYWLTVDLAARRPLLLAVDDVQWADAASLRWLGYLGRRLDGVPVLLVLARRQAEPGTDTTLVDHVIAATNANVLRPAPLTEPGIMCWLERAFGQPASAEFVTASRTATGGNPLLLRELAASMRAEGSAMDAAAARRIASVAPASIGRAVLLRLAPLGPEASAIAQATAVLSADARLDRAAALAGVPVHRAAELVDRLTAAAILSDTEPLSFSHPILRAAVYDQTPSRQRGLAHLAAAERLLQEDDDAERAASHLLHAPPGGREWVAVTLRRAASAACARGAPEAAVALLRRAVAEPPSERVEAMIDLAAAEALAQAPEAATHACEAMRAATPSQAARAAMIAARTLTFQRRFDEAAAVLRQLEPQAPALDADTRHAVEAEALVVSGWHSGGAGYERRLTSLSIDAMRGDTPGERALLTLRFVQLVLDGHRSRDDLLGLGRRIVARMDPGSAEDYALYLLGRNLAVIDATDEAREFLDRVIDEGRSLGAVARVAISSVMRAEVDLRAGRLLSAESDAREALRMAQEHGIDVAIPAALAHLIEITVDRRGRDLTLESLAAEQLAGDERRLSYAAQLLRCARGRARLERGDLHGGVSDLKAVGTALEPWHDRNPANLAWRSRLALALGALGQHAEAQALAEEELRLAEHFGARRAIGIALRAHALLGDGRHQIAGLRCAVDVLAGSPARLELARSLLDLGAALRRAGERVEARTVLARALDEADRCGADRLAAAARSELLAAGARPRRARLSGPDALTASERRVAELATEGRTNRQIAQALFVTVKTVEMHLARTYAKLDIHSRAELAPALAGAVNVTP